MLLYIRSLNSNFNCKSLVTQSQHIKQNETSVSNNKQPFYRRSIVVAPLPKEQQKFLLDTIFHQLGLKSLDDWYTLSISPIKTKLNPIISQYNDLPSALQQIYPEHDWKPWKFKTVSHTWWDNITNQKAFLEYARLQLGVKTNKDWGRVKSRHIEQLGGKGLLERYQNSFRAVLQMHYPESLLGEPWLLSSLPSKFWSLKENQIRYMNWLAKELNINNYEEWYNVRKSTIKEKGGSGLLRQYKYSYYRLLCSIFPDIEWKPSKFGLSFIDWNDVSVQRAYMEKLGSKLGVKNLDDWYTVHSQSVRIPNGLAKLYSQSLSKALQSIYPEHTWHFWKFVGSPKSVWDDITKQREFFDFVYKELKLKSMEDWYEVKAADIKDLGGAGLLTAKYKTSIYKALKTIYPDYSWKPWKFLRLPKNGLLDSELLREYLDELAKSLKIKNFEDWYRVSVKQIYQWGKISFILNESLPAILQKAYPEYPWDVSQFSLKAKKSIQMFLRATVAEIFEEEEIKEDFLHPDLKFQQSMTRNSMELDVYVPRLSLAFEYQGEQHYQSLPAFTSLSLRQELDEEKRLASTRAGITVIEVPYWWDRTKESLIATIRQVRPDLLCEYENLDAKPIPLEPNKVIA